MAGLQRHHGRSSVRVMSKTFAMHVAGWARPCRATFAIDGWGKALGFVRERPAISGPSFAGSGGLDRGSHASIMRGHTGGGRWRGKVCALMVTMVRGTSSSLGQGTRSPKGSESGASTPHADQRSRWCSSVDVLHLQGPLLNMPHSSFYPCHHGWRLRKMLNSFDSCILVEAWRS